MAGTLTNIVLDQLFILTFDWGVAGAAAAMMISILISNSFTKTVAYSTHHGKLPIVLRAVLLYTQPVNKKREFPIRNQEG